MQDNETFHQGLFEYVSRLGEGSYGSVLLCRDHSPEEGTSGQGRRLVAVKRFKWAHTDNVGLRLALREVHLLKSLDHPLIIRLDRAFFSRSCRLYAVFPYMEGGCGQSALKSRFQRGMPPVLLKSFAWQLCLAVRYLHSQEVLHRDIKPANVLLSVDGTIRLSDFGFARRFADLNAPGREVMEDSLTPYVQTRPYRAPEVLLGQVYGAPADVWALGATIAEMATGAPLLTGTSSLDQLWRILGALPGPQPPPVVSAVETLRRLDPGALGAPVPVELLRPKKLPGRPLRERLSRLEPGLVDFIEACLRLDTAVRATAEELLQMPWFADVRRAVAGNATLERLYDEEAERRRTPPPPPASPPAAATWPAGAGVAAATAAITPDLHGLARTRSAPVAAAAAPARGVDPAEAFTLAQAEQLPPQVQGTSQTAVALGMAQGSCSAAAPYPTGSASTAITGQPVEPGPLDGQLLAPSLPAPMPPVPSDVQLAAPGHGRVAAEQQQQQQQQQQQRRRRRRRQSLPGASTASLDAAVSAARLRIQAPIGTHLCGPERLRPGRSRAQGSRRYGYSRVRTLPQLQPQPQPPTCDAQRVRRPRRMSVPELDPEQEGATVAGARSGGMSSLGPFDGSTDLGHGDARCAALRGAWSQPGYVEVRQYDATSCGGGAGGGGGAAAAAATVCERSPVMSAAVKVAPREQPAAPEVPCIQLGAGAADLSDPPLHEQTPPVGRSSEDYSASIAVSSSSKAMGTEKLSVDSQDVSNAWRAIFAAAADADSGTESDVRIDTSDLTDSDAFMVPGRRRGAMLGYLREAGGGELQQPVCTLDLAPWTSRAQPPASQLLGSCLAAAAPASMAAAKQQQKQQPVARNELPAGVAAAAAEPLAAACVVSGDLEVSPEVLPLGAAAGCLDRALGIVEPRISGPDLDPREPSRRSSRPADAGYPSVPPYDKLRSPSSAYGSTSAFGCLADDTGSSWPTATCQRTPSKQRHVGQGQTHGSLRDSEDARLELVWFECAKGGSSARPTTGSLGNTASSRTSGDELGRPGDGGGSIVAGRSRGPKNRGVQGGLQSKFKRALLRLLSPGVCNGYVKGCDERLVGGRLADQTVGV